ncbi:MAG: D-2-hydroxyacid dehydrogenase [Eubacteriales bacterium]|nr:D-2-hydroxyacid dehydrogenase [Eubacteriales bacterium]
MKILVTYPVTSEQLEAFANCSDGAEICVVPQSDITQAHVEDADVIIGNIPPSMVNSAKKLKFLQLTSSGADSYVSCMRDGLQIAVTSGAYGLAISEHMLGMYLMLLKKLNLYRDNQHKSLWHDEGNVNSIEDAVVLTVGIGSIGGDFARKCKLLGAHTIGIRRNINDKPDYIDELYTLHELAEVAKRADCIALALPGGKTTERVLNKKIIDSLKHGVIVLNVGRGSAIDTEALTDAVERGDVLCGLDVTDPEPLPESHRLWKQVNAVITPHISGFFHLRQTLERIGEVSRENLSRYIRDEQLLNLLDAETGYRRTEGRYNEF